MSTHPITVAVASDFLTAFSRIPRQQQAKVLDFVNKFRADPTLPGINYEKIQRAKDPNLRSVRIDQSYRGIVLKPEKGNVYVLLWVDQHDKAYAWAENRIYTIHPETGSLQVVDVQEGSSAQTPQSQIPATQEGGLFADIRDRHLLRLGVPEVLLPLVRNLKTQEELDHLSTQLPQEAYEALFFLASGYSLEEVFREMEKPEAPPAVDTNDYAAALENPDSRRRFFVVEDDLELTAILSAPLEKWRVFLHPSQRRLVERDWNGAVRVLGGAGTGKTVAAMHRAKWLAQHVFTGANDRILFTTFTRNLAADIRENLSKICSEEAMRRIEVMNLDKWVSYFLHRHGYHYEIDYGERTASLWEQALNIASSDLKLPTSFYREEWERVIQPQGVSSLDEYMKASRLGRGVQLNRSGRKAVWPVFEEYRVLLNEHRLREGDDAMRDARLLIEAKGDILPYRAIVVDEAQDMGTQAFRLLREMIPGGDRQNDLFIVGDAHQRIYRHKVVLGQCGINIRGRSRKLRINYRTTEETRRWATRLLEGVSVDDLDAGLDDQKGYKSLLHGEVPTVRNFSSFREEVDFISQYLRQVENEGELLSAVCLVARTNDLLKQYESAFGEKGCQTYLVRRSEAEDRNIPGLRLATMHRVKGLEFDRVIIAGVNEGIVPYEGAGSDSADPTVQRELDVRERALLYVAATRAKKEVVVTGFGRASRFLGNLSKESRL
ncbi:MAG: ATP-dependent helicase [Deltaproteobacteria bacterium]|nr:ATP-dependent helicase [Deltaproteobacteria bacterium]